MEKAVTGPACWYTLTVLLTGAYKGGVLSVLIVAGGWEYSNSFNVVKIGTAVFAL